MSLNVLATRTVKQHAQDESDEQWLLDVLGLVAEDGTTPPDDTKEYHFSEPSPAPGARNPHAPTAPATTRQTGVAMTTPPGLANLPPAAPEVTKKRRGPKPQPKVIRPRKPREVPECGQYKAWSRHKRRGEPIDEACQEAYREYHKGHSSEHRLRKRKEKEFNRLVSVGVTPASAQVLVEAVL